MKYLPLLVLAACGGAGLAGDRTHQVAYPNGFARFEFELHDGLPNGRGRAWYPDGTLQLEGTYSDGARHGRFWFFSPTGELEYQAIYFNNAEVWRSANATEQPPAEWTRELAAVDGVTPVQRRAARVDTHAPATWLARSIAPVPAFATLDRTTLPRGGVQLGIGGADHVDFGSVVRLDAFGVYRFSRFGVYGQISQTQLDAPMSSLSGRRTLELGGTARHEISAGAFTGRAGLLVPVGNDDTAGFVASTAGVAQRPTDAATSFASSAAARTSASFVRMGERSVLQVDAGIDWLFGTEARPLDLLARANAGVGLGTRRAMLTIELSNTLRVSELTRMHAIGLCGTLAFTRVWLTAGASITQAGDTSLLTSVGYDL